MNRKILQAGPITLAVSLPMHFVKQFKLNKGDEIEVNQEGQTLLISSKKQAKEETGKIIVAREHPLASKVIGILYRNGYETIKAYYEEEELYFRLQATKQLDIAKETFDHLTGMDLWETSGKGKQKYVSCVQHARPNQEEFNQTLDRLMYNVLLQVQNALGSLEEQKNMKAEIALGERLVNQTADLCMRILINAGIEQGKKAPLYYDFVSRLEAIGDKLFHLPYAKHNGKKDANLKLLQDIHTWLQKVISLHHKFDKEDCAKLARVILAKKTSFEKEIETKPEGVLIAFSVHGLMMDVFDMLDPLISLHHEEYT